MKICSLSFHCANLPVFKKNFANKSDLQASSKTSVMNMEFQSTSSLASRAYCAKQISFGANFSQPEIDSFKALYPEEQFEFLMKGNNAFNLYNSNLETFVSSLPEYSDKQIYELLRKNVIKGEISPQSMQLRSAMSIPDLLKATESLPQDSQNNIFTDSDVVAQRRYFNGKPDDVIVSQDSPLQRFANNSRMDIDTFKEVLDRIGGANTYKFLVKNPDIYNKLAGIKYID